MEKRSGEEPETEAKGPDIAELFKRKPWGEAEARAVLKVWQESGIPLETFAQQRGLVAQRLRWWCNRLKVETTAKETRKPVRFTPVRVVERSRRPRPKTEPVEVTKRAASSRGMELELPSGLRIHLEQDFESAALRRLLEVVEGRSC